jgi:hypothetical protein
MSNRRMAGAMTKETKPRDTRNKRTAAQKLDDYAEIEELSHRGLNEGQIAKILSAKRPYTISRSQIQADSKKLEEIWKKNSAIDMDIEKGRMKAHYESLIAECYAMLDASKKDKIITTTNAVIVGGTVKDGKMDGGAIRERSVREQKEKQIGDIAIVKQIESLLREYKDLFGMDAPKRSEVTGKDGVPLTPPVDHEGYNQSINALADAVGEIISGKNSEAGN